MGKGATEMKNQIDSFLRDERGDGLDDLLLLVVLIATAIFAAIAVGIALAGIIGLIALLVVYIKYLCKLWREGKKGWFWIGIILLTIALVICGWWLNYLRMAPVREKQWAEELRIKNVQEETDFRTKMQQLPFNGHQFDIQERVEGLKYYLSLDIDKEMERYVQKFFLGQHIPGSEFIILPPETWSFNGKSFSQFLQQNELSCDTTYHGFGRVRQIDEGYTPYVSVTVSPNNPEKLREVCVKLSNPTGSVEKFVCISCRFP